MTTTLTAMLDETLASALAGAGSVRTHLESARAALAHDLTVVVTGRRGVGKSTALNAMLAEPVVEVGYSAEDRPVQIVGSDEEAAVPWAVATRVPTTLARGRRYVDPPEAPVARGVERSAAGGRSGARCPRPRDAAPAALGRDGAPPARPVRVADPAARGARGRHPGRPPRTATALEELPDRLGASARLVEGAAAATSCTSCRSSLPAPTSRHGPVGCSTTWSSSPSPLPRTPSGNGGPSRHA